MAESVLPVTNPYGPAPSNEPPARRAGPPAAVAAAPLWTRLAPDGRGPRSGEGPPVDAAEVELREIARAQQDPRAFGALYRRHHVVIAAYIHRRVGDSHLTEDLVADVFMTALQSLPRYRARGVPLRAWLYRIASNRVNRWARRERRKALQQLDAEPCADGRTGVTEQIDEHHARERARAALLTLAPKFQTVLALHYLEGMPIEEVATTVGCRVGTVKSRLSRGREQLRRRLTPRRSEL